MNMHKIFQLSGFQALWVSLFQNSAGHVPCFYDSVMWHRSSKKATARIQIKKKYFQYLFHCCSIAGVDSEENTQKGEPME